MATDEALMTSLALTKPQLVHVFHYVIREIWNAAGTEDNVKLKELVDQALTARGVKTIYEDTVRPLLQKRFPRKMSMKLQDLELPPELELDEDDD